MIQLGQQDVRVMIDTGFNGTLHLSTLDDVPLVYPPQSFDGLAILGVGGTEPRTAESQIDGDVRLGPVRWRNADVGTTRGHPSIGTAALCWWRLVFDQSAGEVYFLGNNDMMAFEKRRPIDPRYKSGVLGEIQGRFIRLVEVDSGGAFDRAGLRVGDLITGFDGMLPLEWLRGRARGEIPFLNAMQLSVLRNGAKFEATVLQGPENGSNH